MAGGNLSPVCSISPPPRQLRRRGGTGFFNVCVAARRDRGRDPHDRGILLLLRGFTKGELAGDDPWEGHTLEWVTTSPPPQGNFTAPLPEITSDRPLLDLR